MLNFQECSKEELGLESGVESKFYPVNEKAAIFLEKNDPRFYCFDQS